MNKETVEELSFKLAEYGQKAILYEAALTPKPGLVDAVDPGAHRDMNIYTFIDSCAGLFKGFYLYGRAGLLCSLDEKGLFSEARNIGIGVERDMFKATGNVNTHKGINFSLGIVLAAAGRYLKESKKTAAGNFTERDTAGIAEIVRGMTAGLVERDFKGLNKKETLTNGERLYLETGFSGIRGEVEKGFPTVVEMALPRLRFVSGLNMSTESKLLDVLFHIMKVSEDSNVVGRGGFKALDFVRGQAGEFIEGGGTFNEDYKEKIEQMNKVFIEKNISPGGSADLLSVTLFFAFLESVI